jgi:hypothetical protein
MFCVFAEAKAFWFGGFFSRALKARFPGLKVRGFHDVAI